MLTTKVQKHQGFLRKKEVSMKKVLSIALVMAMLLGCIGVCGLMLYFSIYSLMRAVEL